MPSNCYGYAIGVDLAICPGRRNSPDSVIEDWTDGFEKHPFIDGQKEVLLDACRHDGLRDMDAAGRKIAVFVQQYDDCIDYHFYRQEDNNLWSARDSPGGPITEGIQDPVEFNKSLVGKQLHTGVLKGQMYAGTLYMPSGESLQDGWD